MKALDQLIKTALLGTSRASTDSIDWPQPVSEQLQKFTKEDAESFLLQSAALLFSFQEAGQTFPHSSTPIKAAPEEQRAYCSKLASQLLQRILQDKSTDLVQHWLEACMASQHIVYPQHLPSLLNLGKNQLSLRQSVQAVMGERGKWLAQMNPAWAYILSTDKQIWEEGKTEERKYLLQNLREKDPQAALSLLQSSWKSESADLRAEFLTLLEINLNANDLPFLEETLLDKSKKVKSTALNLLLLQKDSFIVQKIFHAASAMLEVKKSKSLFGFKGPAIAFRPTSMDRQLAEYGVNLESLDKNFSNEEYYTYELIEVINPAHWENHFQMEASALLQAFQKEEKLTKFIPVLMEASVLHRNTHWANIFAEHLQKNKITLPKDKQYLSQEIIRVLTEQEKIRYFPASWSGLSLLEYLRLCDFSWTADFSRKALQQLYRQYMESGINPYERDKMAALHKYLHPEILKEKNSFLPPDQVRKASWREAIELLFGTLELRTSIHNAFKI
ncbi:DUF5691 domain-containing protein [Catalinimonas sp. 4WD22]|uniref:DUF5691 domain-containing protein n=1 Tax=Catalinimonas locisalis TaxID=3133978 RepID=UPI0031014D3B